MALLVGSLLFYVTLYPPAWRLFIGPYYMGYPFLDLHGVLSYAEGYNRGWNLRTLESNPLDFLKRGNTAYPNLWYSLPGALGFTRQHEIPLALMIVVGFLSFLLFFLYPRSWKDVLIGFLVICSPGALLAMERGNNDLVIFLLLAIVPLCFEWRSRVGFPLAWTVLLFATALKYYPITGYILFVRNIKQLRLLFWYAFAAFFAVSAYFAVNVEDFLQVPRNLRAYTDPIDVFTFGAKGFFYFISYDREYLGVSVLLGFLAILGGAAFFAKKTDSSLLPSSQWRENYFLLGVAISAFAFFLISSYDYRTIFLLFTFPYLLELGKDSGEANRLRIAARVLTALLIIVMWIETVYFFVVLDPVQRQWHAVGVGYVVLIKHGLAWIVMAMLVGLAFLLLKPSVARLWASLPPLIKEKSG